MTAARMPALEEDPAARLRAAARDPTRCVLEGLHTLKHALRFGATVEVAWTPDPPTLARLTGSVAPDLARAIGNLVTPVAPEVFAALAPQPPATGVLAIALRPSPDRNGPADAGGPAVLLEDPRHLGNVGAAIRVAAAAGARALFTTGSSDPWHPAALRGSAGLHFALPVRRLDDLPTGAPLIAIDPEGEDVTAVRLPPDAVLVFGTERGGLRPETLARCGARIAIPMRAGVSSLNLATAVAIALYACRLRAT